MAEKFCQQWLQESLDVCGNPTGGHSSFGQTTKASTAYRSFWQICKYTNIDIEANLQKGQKFTTAYATFYKFFH